MGPRRLRSLLEPRREDEGDEEQRGGRGRWAVPIPVAGIGKVPTRFLFARVGGEDLGSATGGAPGGFPPPGGMGELGLCGRQSRRNERAAVE